MYGVAGALSSRRETPLFPPALSPVSGNEANDGLEVTGRSHKEVPMTQHRLLQALTLASLTTLLAGAAGCSQGQGPTEPASVNASAASKSLASSLDKSHGGRNGSDDPAGDDHRGAQGGGTQAPGTDDPNGDRHGGRNGGGNQGGQQGGQHPPRGSELEGAVTAVDPAAGLVTLAGGKKIAVNAQTAFDRRGDLFTLAKLAGAVTAGKHVRAEAHGTLQADGSLLATTIKAEIDR
jgi:hypothetical protein